jgi:mono/diheme cytochrome c family protein
VVALLIATAFASVCQAQTTPDIGKTEFISNCASCHGADAKGNGPVASSLKIPPTDLTVLAKNNGGVLPVNALYEIIDGRRIVASHGTREMPVWGYRLVPPGHFVLTPSDDFIVPPPASAEPVVYARILAIIDYLNRIQQR